MAAVKAEAFQAFALVIRGAYISRQTELRAQLSWFQLPPREQEEWLRTAKIFWSTVERLQREHAKEFPGWLAQRTANEHTALDALHTWLHAERGDAELIEACDAYHDDRSDSECRRAHERAIEAGTLHESTPFERRR